MVVREPRIQPPQLESYSDMPLFNTKAVVLQTGVPAPTLRAWERRYGILSPRRGENDYRLYSERDMAIVSWLRDRVEAGLTISQAIALLRSMEPSRRTKRRNRAAGLPITHEPPESGAYDRQYSGQATLAPAPARFSLDDIGHALLGQFMNLDEASAARTVAQAFAIYSVEDVCLYLFLPTLVRVGELWREGEVSVTVEHFASSLVRAQLESLFRSALTPESGPLAMVGCAPGELHELGALMLALFLRRANIRVVYLGQSVETESLLQTVESVRPACVLLSAALRPQAEALSEVGRRLTELGQRQPEFYFGGQAFSSAPEIVERIQGTYLGLDAQAAAEEIKRRLSA